MSHSYRKDRYKHRRAGHQESWLRVLITVVLLILAFAFAGSQWVAKKKLTDVVSSKEKVIATYSEELDILRTLNPYPVKPDEILAKASQSVDLFPGWVTRVYPVPKNLKDVNFLQDVGAFVMNETRFSMASHKRYGIPQPSKSMYRLNGLFPNHNPGRLQVGVELYFDGSPSGSVKETMSKISACYVRVDINQKRVIEKRVNVITRFQDEQVVIGDVELKKGLHPITAMMFCDESSDLHGDDIEISISFRNPGQHQLTTSRHSIFHIYKPNNFTARL